MGRAAGETYTDFKGIKRVSAGRFAGINLEYKRFKQPRGGWIEIRPIKPSNAYEWAEEWLLKDYLPNALKRTIKRLNISKYLVFK